LRPNLTNEFVYKNEGVGAMAEQSDQIRKIFTFFGEKIGVFLNYQYYDQLFSKFSFVSSQKRQFFAENWENRRKL
jgi:hypothetical protein